MKSTIRLVFASLLLGSITSACSALAPPPTGSNPGTSPTQTPKATAASRVILKFKSNVTGDSKELLSSLKKQCSCELRYLTSIAQAMHVYQIENTTKTGEILLLLSKHPQVEFSELDGVAKIAN